MDTAVGKITYTQLLNERGGIEADVTVTRLAADRFYLVTGSGFGRHDVTFLFQHAPTDGSRRHRRRHLGLRRAQRLRASLARRASPR